MAELLKIQPASPQIATRPYPVPAPPASYIGRGLTQMGVAIQKLQDASDDAEFRMLTATAKERLAGTIKTTDLEFEDPDEFTTKASERVQEARDAILGSATNARVRGLLEAGLQDELIKSDFQVQYNAHAKRLDRTKANSEVFLEDAERRLMNATDPVDITNVEQEIADHMRLMRQTGALKPADAVKRIQRIKENDAYSRASRQLRAIESGMTEEGKPIIQNPDGTVSTEKTITIEADGRFFLIPTIIQGRELSEDAAVAAWRRGENKEVGAFSSEAEANKAASERSKGLGAYDIASFIDSLPSRFPNVDPQKFLALEGRAFATKKRIQEEAERRAKEAKEDLILKANIDALNGRLSQAQIEDLATKNRFSPDDYKGLVNSIEQGGVTDPVAFAQLKSEIMQGRMLNYRTILNHGGLDKQARSELMGLITSRRDHFTSEGRTNHFSKKPEYDQALKEYRAAITSKGPLESLSDLEQRQYEWGLRTLWDRVEKGEDPLAVGREISERAKQVKESGFLNAGPVAAPRYQSPEELVDALRRGRITRRQFDEEALILEQKKKLDEAAERRRRQRLDQPERERGRR